MDKIYPYNTRDILERAFGLTGLSIYTIPSEDDAVGGSAGTTPIELDTDGDFDGTGLLGLPVFCNLVVQQFNYKDQGKVFTYPGITLQDVIIDCTLQKNIVVTAIVGRQGTVKESVSMGDYQITIRGVLVSKNINKSPSEDLQRLRKLFELPYSISVECKLLQWLGIYNIVIKDVSLPRIQGSIDVQPYEINAISDMPMELVLNQQ